MKLLLFSDLHCNATAAQALVERARQVDVVIGAGDFANLRRGLNRTIDVLKTIEQPAVLVPGNSESVEELAEACRGWPNAHVLHGAGVEVAGISFFGLGGAVPVTPFGSWSYDFSEEQARSLLTNCPRGGVLVSHSPPRGLVDTDSSGRHLGSLAVREIIEQQQPALVVCGHIHASAGQQATLGPTTVINAGPAGVEYQIRPSV
ncbi:MAG TPA: metallophosphoesterase family protein [Anaerolineae bacterium]|nr:metallophosphoesterase family protein [Anaerolineae bacterium]